MAYFRLTGVDHFTGSDFPVRQGHISVAEAAEPIADGYCGSKKSRTRVAPPPGGSSILTWPL